MTRFEAIPNFLRINNIINFKVRRSKDDMNTVVFVSDSDISLEENIRKLEKLFETEKDSYYYLDGSSKEGRAGSTHRYSIEFSNDNEEVDEKENIKTIITEAISGITPQAEGKYTEEFFNEKLATMQKEIYNKFKEDDLTRREKELAERVTAFEKEKINGMNLFLSKIGSVLPSIMGQKTPQQAVPISGVKENTMSCSELEKEILQVFGRWLSVDRDALSFLHKIADMAVSGNPLYKTGKQFLMNDIKDTEDE